jgi:predicted porin
MNNTGAGANTAKFNGWQLGSDYNLSKRTNLYAIYGQTATSNAVTGAYAATSNPSATSQPTSYNASSYAVGVRHTF